MTKLDTKTFVKTVTEKLFGCELFLDNEPSANIEGAELTSDTATGHLGGGPVRLARLKQSPLQPSSRMFRCDVGAVLTLMPGANESLTSAIDRLSTTPLWAELF